MKKISIYILAFAALYLTSCNEAIDIDQPGRFSAENAFQSVEDLRLGLFGAYNELDVSDYIGFNSTFTDECAVGFDSGGQAVNDGRLGFLLNSTSLMPEEIWIDSYDAINASTRLIIASEIITPEASELETYNNIVGQAYAIRAWSHFNLLSYYSTDYTNDAAPCVILVDFVPELDQELGRNTTGEIANLILSDLDQANALMNDDTSDPTFMNKDFVTALKARLAAYREDYTAAAGFAKTLSDKYPLADRTQYFDMYDDLDNTEVIFKLERSVGDDYDRQDNDGGGWIGALYAFIDATRAGSPFLEMGRTLFESFSPDDIRYDRNVAPTSAIDMNYPSGAEDILVIQKYPGSDGQPLMNDLKIFRSSEMVLIQAEAAAASGDLAGAAAYVKMIRDARFGTDTAAPNYGSSSAAWAGILAERRLEFCFEGHRYLDIKRMGPKANRSVDRDPLDFEFNQEFNIANDDHRFSLPIPQVEQDGNSVIRDQQNPGY